MPTRSRQCYKECIWIKDNLEAAKITLTEEIDTEYYHHYPLESLALPFREITFPISCSNPKKSIVKKPKEKKMQEDIIDLTNESIPTKEPKRLYMEDQLYHELMEKNLSMKTNSQNIFIKQMKSSAVIDCLASVGHKIPNVECIVNLIHHILEPGIAELLKCMFIWYPQASKLINWCFKYNLQTNWFPVLCFLRHSLSFMDLILQTRDTVQFMLNLATIKLVKYQLGWLHFVLTNVLTDLNNIKFSVRLLSLYWQNAAMMHGLSKDIIIIYLCHKMIWNTMKKVPMDPVVDIIHAHVSNDSSIPTAILFVPSCGIFYSPYFYCKTPHIAAMAKVVGNQAMGNLFSLEQLPATALRIQRKDGLCAKGGFLSSFSKLFHYCDGCDCKDWTITSSI